MHGALHVITPAAFIDGSAHRAANRREMNRDMVVFQTVAHIGLRMILAGAVAAPLLSVTPDMGLQILIPTLIVIVIGGLGSLKGAIAGSLIFGFVQTFGAVLAPQLASVLIYALLAAVLVIRPVGLFPAKG